MDLIELTQDELDEVNGAYLLGSAFNGGFSWGGLAFLFKELYQ